MTLNLAELTDAELAELHRKVRQESETRFLLKIPDDALVGERTGYLRRFGWQYPLGEDGDEWQQPLATMDAYMKGDRRRADGQLWENTIDFNVHRPGVSGWRVVAADGPPPWTQPAGAHDAYGKGDRVTHNGRVWESTAAGNVWAPGVYGWKDVGPA